MTEAVVGFVGVIIGSILSPSIEWIKSYFKSKQDATYLSVRVICILDKFIDDCVVISQDFGETDQDGFYYYKLQSPTLEPLPTEVDWKSINTKIMYDILNFPNKIESAHQYLKASSDWVDPPYDGYAIERQKQFSNLGLEAYSIIEELVKVYGIPYTNHHIASGWNAINFLKATYLSSQKSLNNQNTLPEDFK